ncbi:Feline leukemia virus subgroup C cellular receptor [Apophysomyces sp. BC1015]|nr:Feline leukemia virus subgroup C cellular receptor [Apophysomyces sp. BC1015]KAG0177566.1 Feline leukemia virus subgroup C cellular receptor [Apophysomyces sp. BC1021]
MAALAQVFLLAVPPRLAVSWFPENEVNLATSIAVSANNLGVAAGCALTPLMVRSKSMSNDIPRLLLIQFIACLLVLVFTWFSLERFPPYTHSDNSEENSAEQSKQLWKNKSFILMLIAYGTIMGAQCAIVSLLAQILIPPFSDVLDETYIGLIGSMMLLVGVPASIGVGCYLDRTLNYRFACNLLFLSAFISVLGLYVSTELKSLLGVIVFCLFFGIASYAIAPAMFQYASELFYPISEIIPTGYLLTVGNIQGLILVACMGWGENISWNFTMRLPMAFLTLTMLVGAVAVSRVDGALKRPATLLE